MATLTDKERKMIEKGIVEHMQINNYPHTLTEVYEESRELQLLGIDYSVADVSRAMTNLKNAGILAREMERNVSVFYLEDNCQRRIDDYFVDDEDDVVVDEPSSTSESVSVDEKFNELISEFKNNSVTELKDIALQSISELNGWFDNDETWFQCCLILAAVGVENSSGNYKVKKFIDEVFGDLWNGDIEDIHEMIRILATEGDSLETIEKLADNVPDMAMDALNLILAFAMADGSITTSLRKRLMTAFEDAILSHGEPGIDELMSTLNKLSDALQGVIERNVETELPELTYFDKTVYSNDEYSVGIPDDFAVFVDCEGPNGNNRDFVAVFPNSIELDDWEGAKISIASGVEANTVKPEDWLNTAWGSFQMIAKQTGCEIDRIEKDYGGIVVQMINEACTNYHCMIGKKGVTGCKQFRIIFNGIFQRQAMDEMVLTWMQTYSKGGAASTLRKEQVPVLSEFKPLSLSDKRVTIGSLDVVIPKDMRYFGNEALKWRGKKEEALSGEFEFVAVSGDFQQPINAYMDAPYSINIRKPQFSMELGVLWAHGEKSNLCSQLEDNMRSFLSGEGLATNDVKSMVVGDNLACIYTKWGEVDDKDEFWRSYKFFVAHGELLYTGMFFFNCKRVDKSETDTYVVNWLKSLKTADNDAIDEYLASVKNDVLGPLAGGNGKISGQNATMLFSQDVLFFNDGDLVDTGNGIDVKGIQFNQPKLDEFDFVRDNAMIIGDEVGQLIKYVEANKKLTVPKSAVHPGILEGTKGLGVSGVTLFEMCAWHMLFITNDTNDEYNVLIDQNIIKGVPDGYNLVAEFIRTLRAYNGNDDAFTVNFDAMTNFDGPCDIISTPVAGAAQFSQRKTITVGASEVSSNSADMEEEARRREAEEAERKRKAEEEARKRGEEEARKAEEERKRQEEIKRKEAEKKARLDAEVENAKIKDAEAIKRWEETTQKLETEKTNELESLNRRVEEEKKQKYQELKLAYENTMRKYEQGLEHAESSIASMETELKSLGVLKLMRKRELTQLIAREKSNIEMINKRKITAKETYDSDTHAYEQKSKAEQAKAVKAIKNKYDRKKPIKPASQYEALMKKRKAEEEQRQFLDRLNNGTFSFRRNFRIAKRIIYHLRRNSEILYLRELNMKLASDRELAGIALNESIISSAIRQLTSEKIVNRELERNVPVVYLTESCPSVTQYEKYDVTFKDGELS